MVTINRINDMTESAAGALLHPSPLQNIPERPVYALNHPLVDKPTMQNKAETAVIAVPATNKILPEIAMSFSQ